MLRFTEAEFHARTFSRVPRQVSDDANAKPAPGVFEQDAASSEGTIGSSADENSHIEKGGMVSTRAEALYATRALLPSPPEYVMLRYPISANRYWRNFRGRMVLSSEARAYKADVIRTFDAFGVIPTTRDVAISVILHPKLTKKGKASRTVCDLDNVLKVIFDALQGVLYINDKQVKKLTAEVGEPVDGGGLSVWVMTC